MSTGSVVVTGAGGFIASRVVHQLRERGVQLRLLYGPSDDASHVPTGAQWLQGDIEDRALVAELVAGASSVIHLAGPPSVRLSFEDPVGYARVHVAGTVALLEACERARVKRFIYVSSAEVYGCGGRVPAREEQPAQPRSPYAAAKFAAEAFVRAFSARGVQAIVLRLFSVYGRGQSPQGVLHHILSQATAGTRIKLENLAPVRDYVHVDDVAEAILLALETPLSTAFREFNVGTGRATSIAELARTVTQALGRDVPVLELAGTAPRPTDIPWLVADTTRIQTELGWTPTTALPRGIQRTVKMGNPEWQ